MDVLEWVAAQEAGAPHGEEALEEVSAAALVVAMEAVASAEEEPVEAGKLMI